MSDPYTTERELCDADGIVRGKYLDLLNHLRRLRHDPMGKAFEPITKEFPCTGSAHLAGEHIRCTSAAHAEPDWSGITKAPTEPPGHCPGGAGGQHVLTAEETEAARGSLAGKLVPCLLCGALIMVPPVVSVGEVA